MLRGSLDVDMIYLNKSTKIWAKFNQFCTIPKTVLKIYIGS